MGKQDSSNLALISKGDWREGACSEYRGQVLGGGLCGIPPDRCPALGLSRLVAVIVIDHNKLVKTVLYQ